MAKGPKRQQLLATLDQRELESLDRILTLVENSIKKGVEADGSSADQQNIAIGVILRDVGILRKFFKTPMRIITFPKNFSAS